MNFIRSIAGIPPLLLGLCCTAPAAPADPPASMSSADLNRELRQIDTSLQELARYSPRGGIGPIGYRSEEFDDPTQSVQLRINLKQPAAIDQVVLVPTLMRSPAKNFRPDGFPGNIRILDEKGNLLSERNTVPDARNRIAPHVFDFPARTVSSIVIEAARLSPRAFDGKYVLQLAEILVFSGQENLALGCTVQPSSAGGGRRQFSSVWQAAFLTDGFLPYLMNREGGRPSLAYLSPRAWNDDPQMLSVDLGKPQPLTEIHLHMVDQSDTVPQSAPDGVGMPRHLRVEGANRSDFSDARTLLEIQGESIYDFAPIMMRRFPPARCRYVRLVPLVPYLYPYSAKDLKPRIGFAEVMLFAGGINVAAGKTFSSPGDQTDGLRPTSALSDGNNIFGPILPVRDWMGELAQRHELETRRPLITEELNRRYRRQQATLLGLSWLAAISVGLVIIIILIDRNVRQRVAFKTREQIAADLHDELGANLHAMGLLSDLAHAGQSEPDKTKGYLNEMRALTEQTGAAARHCTNLLEAEDLYDDPVSNIKRAAKRLLADLDHRLLMEGTEFLDRLSPRRRLDLFLFYKECLTNVLRHSGATEACTRLVADRYTVTLTVSDNGKGLPQGDRTALPASLRRRARLMRARATASPNSGGGTVIRLKMRNGFPFKKFRKQ